MEVLELLRQALKTSVSVIKAGAGIQEKARKELVQDLQKICQNCETSYEAVLKRLAPIKDTFRRPDELAKELRAFAADPKARQSFKPERLCGEIDHLLVRLESNLDPLKYAIDISRIQEVKRTLGLVGNYDAAIYRSYDEFARQLDELATQIRDPRFDANERAEYVQRVIREFDEDLRATIDNVRATKKEVLKMA